MSKIVIKYGGHAMDDPNLRAPFAKSIAELTNKGMNIVLVHGGGPHINKLLGRLQIESQFTQGLRITDAAVMEVVEMALCGQVNKAVVTLLQENGAMAVGLCGKDAKLLCAEILQPELGLVGNVTSVNDSILQCLLESSFIPVVAPIAYGHEGQSLNVNADTAAGAIAGAVQADYFVLVSDVPGVLDAQNQLLRSLNRKEIDELKAEGVISGGMIPKVDACLYALDAGCKKALILDGRAESSLQRYLLNNEELGTVIINE